MRTYTQLTAHQRYLIYAYQKIGYNQKQIAQAVCVSASTISRELNRHSQGQKYDPNDAHIQAIRKRRYGLKSRKFERLSAIVCEKLSQQWSPEQICGWLKKTHHQSLSHQCIYNHVQLDRLSGGRFYRHLRQGHKRRRKVYGGKKKLGPIQDRIDISTRPAIVEAKTRIGDWEIDTFFGQHHQPTFLTLVERRSRLTVVGKAKSKKAKDIAALAIRLLKPFKPWVHTLTADNGCEFAGHKQIAKALDAQVFFAHPYSPWQRGCCENTIGLLRQYFPKKTSLNPITDSHIKQVLHKLNRRPRKGLNFQAPLQVFLTETAHPDTIALVF